MSQSLEEELGDVGNEDNVLKATMLFKSIMDLTYQESIRAKDKAQIRDLVTNLMQIIQVQNKKARPKVKVYRGTTRFCWQQLSWVAYRFCQGVMTELTPPSTINAETKNPISIANYRIDLSKIGPTSIQKSASSSINVENKAAKSAHECKVVNEKRYPKE
ncbi:hypothetical protein CEXT_796991 [Caerostris extrusa]|uniref:Uncharacterized protein n=1 Tax=Caerostris extrusa TaxID=172846 RepID=A0AAV4QE12_CAEEX|nr:hypothetical protein CEXT_796991 [Caerostris extrusa]